MNSRRWIGLYAIFVLVAMTWVSWRACVEPTITSLPQFKEIVARQEGIHVFLGYITVCAEPWGLATMFDAYFGFLAFWLYIAWRERSALKIAAWLVALLFLGNFAIAGYALVCLWQTPATADLTQTFFTRRSA